MKIDKTYRQTLMGVSAAITLSLIIIGLCSLVIFNPTNNWTSAIILFPVWVGASVLAGLMVYAVNRKG